MSNTFWLKGDWCQIHWFNSFMLYIPVVMKSNRKYTEGCKMMQLWLPPVAALLQMMVVIIVTIPIAKVTLLWCHGNRQQSSAMCFRRPSVHGSKENGSNSWLQCNYKELLITIAHTIYLMCHWSAQSWVAHELVASKTVEVFCVWIFQVRESPFSPSKNE